MVALHRELADAKHTVVTSFDERGLEHADRPSPAQSRQAVHEPNGDVNGMALGEPVAREMRHPAPPFVLRAPRAVALSAPAPRPEPELELRCFFPPASHLNLAMIINDEKKLTAPHEKVSEVDLLEWLLVGVIDRWMGTRTAT